jgi:hypothetical protein
VTFHRQIYPKLRAGKKRRELPLQGLLGWEFPPGLPGPAWSHLTALFRVSVRLKLPCNVQLEKRELDCFEFSPCLSENHTTLLLAFRNLNPNQMLF